MKFRFATALLLACSALAATAQTVPSDLTLTPLSLPGVAQPIAFATPNDGTQRMFVVSRTGNIYVYHLDTNSREMTPLLSVPVSTSSEQGLLGIALHPNFASNGRFYVQHSRASGGGANIGSAADQLTVEYTATPPTTNVVDPLTRRVLVTIGDMASNHNGGGLQFGPDGYLYISMGDGGPQNNPHGFAECLWRKPENNSSVCLQGAAPNYFLLGKILRIDVDGTTATASAEMCGTATGGTAQYRIPVDNPHVGSANTCDEIYHTGMRNPFRFSFDRQTGDMLVGDVGQGSWEEVDLIPSGAGPQNLGWSSCEGRQIFGSGVLDSCMFGTLPILNYAHSAVSPASGKCSITGGYRYRGPINEFVGMIVYADYCSREIFFGKPDGASASGFSATRWATSPSTPILAAAGPIGFGEDQDGNLYLATQSTGGVYRFSSATGASTIFRNGFE